MIVPSEGNIRMPILLNWLLTSACSNRSRAASAPAVARFGCAIFTRIYTAANKTEAQLEFRANLIRTTAGFAGIVGTMESAAAIIAVHRARFCRQFNIELKQNVKKIWTLQEGVAHFEGL
jgi:hypothetical protein